MSIFAAAGNASSATNSVADIGRKTLPLPDIPRSGSAGVKSGSVVRNSAREECKSAGKKRQRYLMSNAKFSRRFRLTAINQARREEGKDVLPTTRRYKPRTVLAEDSEWTMRLMPSLCDMCLAYYLANFEKESEVLRKMPRRLQRRILKKLPTTIPLKITIPLISISSYWERCCRERWRVCDVRAFGRSWKRMFIERHLNELIELFVPGKTDPTELQQLLKMSHRFVRSLDIKQLLPPVREKPPERHDLQQTDKNEEEEEEEEEESNSDHFDFQPVVKELRRLEELHLRYCVRDCGMNFKMNVFNPTYRDCNHLGMCVADCKQLRVLHIYNSALDDNMVRALAQHILDHPSLTELDLSSNRISDLGARCVGKLLRSHCKLTRLSLSDNHIHVRGAQAIGHALAKNKTLTSLDMHLNRAADDGGMAIFQALLTNSTLIEINLSANSMGLAAADMVAEVLLHNNELTTLVLSCNNFGPDGGRDIRVALETNYTVTTMELWMAECGQTCLDQIDALIERNRMIPRVVKKKDDEENVKEKEVEEKEEEKGSDKAHETEYPIHLSPQFAHRFLKDWYTSDDEYLEDVEGDEHVASVAVDREPSIDALKGAYYLDQYEGLTKSGWVREGARIQ